MESTTCRRCSTGFCKPQVRGSNPRAGTNKTNCCARSKRRSQTRVTKGTACEETLMQAQLPLVQWPENTSANSRHIAGSPGRPLDLRLEFTAPVVRPDVWPSIGVLVHQLRRIPPTLPGILHAPPVIEPASVASLPAHRLVLRCESHSPHGPRPRNQRNVGCLRPGQAPTCVGYLVSRTAFRRRYQVARLTPSASHGLRERSLLGSGPRSDLAPFAANRPPTRIESAASRCLRFLEPPTEGMPLAT